MKHVPKYLLPRTAPASGISAEEGEGDKPVGFVPFRKNSQRGRGRGRGGRGAGGRGGKKKSDPLKKFSR